MKNANIYIFKDVSGIESLAGMLVIKELFINKSFVNQGYIIITLSGDMKKRKEVYWEDMKKYLVPNAEYNLNSFTKEYKYEIELIYQYKEKNKIILSWLEICQYAVLLRLEPTQDFQALDQIAIELKNFNEYAEKMM